MFFLKIKIGFKWLFERKLNLFIHHNALLCSDVTQKFK